ncbi:MAG: Arginine-tRNA ligase [Candidatus Moranbacteria bacterium GW2011_GWC2_37_8]|nr:MAG: Arginine-tRNA ligase [Candidatus Moranbacteria bacterium GW2011_GWC2_37_8]KKQ61614.1 MAG: Arginine-tRNA ligase [Parcubacteria group bacterium GW2011_GWC1_38_22]KKQ80890.1 MAG: Arginine-tRNA ligase [Candidatus Moranbacteria bacterium GW2011_GWD2_38_7]
MKEIIEKILKEALLKAKNSENWPDFEIPASASDGPASATDGPEIVVDYAKSEQFGDYSSNIAMTLAKKVGKSPMEIAGQIVKLLDCYIDKKNTCHSERSEESLVNMDSNINSGILTSHSGAPQDDSQRCFEKIEVAQPGYINFYLSNKYLQNVVGKILAEKELFGNLSKNKEKVIVEYSQPNTHKEFHIGHLRNVFIGNSLVNILRKGGYGVTSANYIGDTGTHIAKCLWGISKFHSEENLDQINNKAEFLGKSYAEAVKAISENPDFENEFKLLQKKFESGDEVLVSLWEKTKQWSLDEFEKIYEELGVNFDVYFWESVEELEGKALLPELLKVDCIQESQGAIVANLEEYGLGVLVLVRKDGSALYGLKDIPLAIKKFKEYDIDKSIVVVDIRQGLYFKQIFKILQLMGFDKDMQHVGYEFVSLKGSESMSSRKGNIIPARFLMDEIIKKVEDKFPGTKAAKEIGLGALKFYMLKYSSQSKIEFDINEAVKLEGSGPYVQYAHARTCSILGKAKENFNFQLLNSNLDLLIHEKEFSLIKELDKFPELIAEVANTHEVHKFPHYAMKLADKFHSFYDACRVIDEGNIELTKARLMLVLSTRIVLGETLRLIGVSAPEKM